MTLFDLIVLAVIALSVVFAVIRGAVREIGTLIVLALAAGATFLLLKPIQAAFGASGSFIATLAIGAGLIFVLFCAFYFGLHLALNRVRLDAKGARIDRIAGGVFGFARGLVLVGLGFLAYDYYLSEERRPDAVTGALTLPVAEGMAGFFESLAPPSTRLDGAPVPGGENPEEDPAPAENAAAEGYRRADRSALTEIVATVTTSESPAPADAPPAPASTDDPIADILMEGDPE